MLKYSKDKFTGEPDLTKAPTLRVKLPLWEGVWKCLVCDEDNNKLFPGASGVSPLDFIKKGTNLAIIMQCGGIWFANGKFGVTWKLVQAVVQNPKPSLLDECLIKLKPSDKAKLKAAAPVEEDDNDVMPSTLVDDSDEEDDEPDVQQQDVQQDVQVEEAVVLSPSPVVVEEPKKKKVVKKKSDA